MDNDKQKRFAILNDKVKLFQKTCNPWITYISGRKLYILPPELTGQAGQNVYSDSLLSQLLLLSYL